MMRERVEPAGLSTLSEKCPCWQELSYLALLCPICSFSLSFWMCSTPSLFFFSVTHICINLCINLCTFCIPFPHSFIHSFIQSIHLFTLWSPIKQQQQQHPLKESSYWTTAAGLCSEKPGIKTTSLFYCPYVSGIIYIYKLKPKESTQSTAPCQLLCPPQALKMDIIFLWL